MMSANLALSFVEASSWAVWVLLATLTGLGSLLLIIGTVTEGKGILWPAEAALVKDCGRHDDVDLGPECGWSVLLICLCWYGLLALYLMNDWNMLDLILVAPVTAAIAGAYGKVLGDAIANYLTKRGETRYRNILDCVWEKYQQSPVPYRFLLKSLEETCLEEGIPIVSLSEYCRLDTQDVDALLDSCCKDNGPTGTRDAVVIVLLYACGLARSEIVSLDIDDYGTERGELVIRGSQTWLRELPKRKRSQLWPFRPLAISAHTGFPFSYWAADRGDAPGPFICHVTSEDEVVPSRPITASKIYHILKIRGEEAGIPGFQYDSLRATGLTPAWPGSIVPWENPLPPLKIKPPGQDWMTLGSAGPDSCGVNFAEDDRLREALQMGFIGHG